MIRISLTFKHLPALRISSTNVILLQDSTEQRRYGLKRIVRGLGASTCSSKTVFFRTLVGILMQPSCAAFSVDELVQLMEKELKLGKEIKNKVMLTWRSSSG